MKLDLMIGFLNEQKYTAKASTEKIKVDKN